MPSHTPAEKRKNKSLPAVSRALTHGKGKTFKGGMALPAPLKTSRHV